MSRSRKKGSSGIGLCLGAGFVALDVIRERNSSGVEIRAAGGSCANVLAILAFLDWTAAPVARIGADAAGDELLSDLRRFSVGTQFLAREAGGRTPVVFQEIYETRAGILKHRFSKDCTICGKKASGYRPLLQAQLDGILDELPTPRAFFFDRVAQANLVLAQSARKAGALVVFEPSGIKDPSLFVECASTAHILKFSHERLSGCEVLVRSLRVPVIVETLGEEGLNVSIRSGGRARSHHLPAFVSTHFTDASGSGDWCTAGLMHGLLQDKRYSPTEEMVGEAVIEALRLGQFLASINCAYRGARGLMYARARQDVRALVRRAMAGDYSQAAENRPGSERLARVMAQSTCVVCARSLERSSCDD